ncbi:histone deacetylase domain-containing protein [Rhizoctonia solani AG-1 IA]|uniref:Histone deacetylase domain-containing protein n=1 Tax=Thanatephorus cucumeris (strain AG1-IA) TaxID=983506 RepID=L8WWM4_THACA|nr:histone deacetylase domain-containing protein [Rhizoctonia solani AG-1 IA]
MKVFYSNKCSLHNPGYEILSGSAVPYLESPNRMSAIMSHLSQLQAQDGSWSQEDVDIDVDAVSEGDLLEVIQQVHHVDYIEYLRDAYEMWVQDGGIMPETFPHPGLMASSKSKAMYAKNLSPLVKDCIVSTLVARSQEVHFVDTFTSALAAVRVVLSALQYLVSESSAQASPGAFALTRPPGHHASPSVCGGYCFFNNAAIAARYLQSRVPNTKIAILDIDYHHGNGSKHTLPVISDPATIDFTGTSEEIGDGPGVGFNLNIPLAQYTTGNIEYIAALQKGLERISEFGSQWLLVRG